MGRVEGVTVLDEHIVYIRKRVWFGKYKCQHLCGFQLLSVFGDFNREVYGCSIWKVFY